MTYQNIILCWRKFFDIISLQDAKLPPIYSKLSIIYLFHLKSENAAYRRLSKKFSFYTGLQTVQERQESKTKQS